MGAVALDDGPGKALAGGMGLIPSEKTPPARGGRRGGSARCRVRRGPGPRAAPARAGPELRGPGRRPGFPGRGSSGGRQLQLARGAAIAVLDTAPHAAETALAAARASDFVLIPCRPATADLVAIGANIDLIRIADKPVAVVINAAPGANPITGQALAAISGYGVNACPVVVHQRIEHVHAFTSGLSASESAPSGKAAAEINELFEWIHGVVSLGEA